MRLKILTTFMVLVGLGLLLAWPSVYRLKPVVKGTGWAQVRVGQFYVLAFGGYVGATLFSFMTAGALSAVMIRQAREEFEKQAVDNMRDLVEGSLEDIRSRKQEEQ